MKGIQHRTKQHNRFSKKRKLSPKGKTNSLEEFIPPKEKVVERPTPPWGRFISLRENDAGVFRECSSRKRVVSLRGKFTLLNGKIVGKVNSSRKKVGERHVYFLRLMFPKCGPISLKYRMKFTRDNFTSPRNLAGERHVSLTILVFIKGRPNSPRDKVAKKENPVRCIIPPMVSLGQR